MATASTPEIATPTSILGGLVPIRIGALFPPTTVSIDLYLGNGEPNGQARVLYSRAGSPPSERNLQKLVDSGVTTLYAAPEQAGELQDQFHDLLTSGLEMPPEVHIEIAREAIRGDIAKAWTAMRCDALVVHSAQFVELIMDVCRPEGDTASLIHSLLQHDSDTFTHVSNVCIYTLLLLKKLGLTDPSQLNALGQAALLHDLGKRHIEKNILKKHGVLSPSERQAMREHPRLGFEELCQRRDMNRDQLLMVFEHHERLDGSGYPVGLVGKEIHWTGQLCAVVDVFDALTGRRPYREPVTADEAVDFLESGIKRHFNKEHVRCWSSLCRQSA